MSYDFTDPNTIAQVDEIRKKNLTELTESELDLLVEYKADVKAWQTYSKEAIEADKERTTAMAACEQKLYELSAESAQELYKQAAEEWERVKNG